MQNTANITSQRNRHPRPHLTQQTRPRLRCNATLHPPPDRLLLLAFDPTERALVAVADQQYGYDDGAGCLGLSVEGIETDYFRG